MKADNVIDGGAVAHSSPRCQIGRLVSDNLLNVRDLTKAFGAEPLFDRIALSVHHGEKIGLVGRNGCGKTTLFRVLSGQLEADDGIIARLRGARIGYLSQSPEFAPDATPREVVSQALQPLRDAIEAWHATAAEVADARGAELERRLEEQIEREHTIEQLGGWAWEHRITEVLQALGVADLVDVPMGRLSGGQGRRVALARMLLEQPDLLMLDEPTNHLDADTVEWLEKALVDYPGALFLITHDRYFLEGVVDRIIELEHGKLVSYPGNYSTYISRKVERMKAEARADDRRLKRLEFELEWLRRSPKARTSKSQHRVKQVEELRDQTIQNRRSDMKMSFSAGQRLSDHILAGRGVYKRYGDVQVLSGVDLVFRRGDKIGLIGPNGCGKSTFMRLLVGQERPDAGVIERGKNTRVGYLDQTRDGLEPDDTLTSALGDGDYVWPGGQKIHKRAYLDRFGFPPRDIRQPVTSLSGGERCRLLLARLVLEDANLLALDEPTNDLDIDSLRVLEESLADFEGSLIVVTHDRYFLNRVCNVIAAWEDDGFVRYEGDYDIYRRLRDERRRRDRSAETEARPKPVRVEPKATGPLKLTWREERELEQAEARIDEAEAEKGALDARLADPDLYRDGGADAVELSKARDALEAELETLYARWTALEAIRSGEEPS